jgi:hypothetical protein
MSAEIPPDPITDTFNPAAWNVPEFTPEEQALLDANFVKYPITQNNTITFPTAPIAPTLPDGTNTTQVATTGFVQNAITAFKAATNVWTALNTFNGGLSATSITRTGTLTITGTPLALTNTRLDTPFSTNYTYPVASDKIGYILTGTFANVANPTISTDYELASLLIPKGVWILQASCGLTSAIANNNALIAINTTATTTDARARQMYSYQFVSASPNIASFTTQLLISINTDTTYYFMAVTNQAISPAFSWNRIIFEATRIA